MLAPARPGVRVEMADCGEAAAAEAEGAAGVKKLKCEAKGDLCDSCSDPTRASGPFSHSRPRSDLHADQPEGGRSGRPPELLGFRLLGVQAKACWGTRLH